MADEEFLAEESSKCSQNMFNCKRILPLYIPSILAHVLEYLPVIDLKNARIISHQWAEEGGKLLAKKTNICFQKEKDVENFLEEESQKKLRNKTEKMTLLSSVRFTNFQFRIGDKWDDYYYTIKSPACEKFFDEMGSSIIGLEMKRGVWKPSQLDDSFFAKVPNVEFFKLFGRVEAPEDTKSILDTEVKLSPSIQTFEISLYPVIYPLDTPHFARSFFETLLLRMPNLSKIKGSLVSVASTDLIMWVVNSQAPLQFLSQLELQIELNESEVLLLQERNFPLTHLEMAINPGIRFGGLWTFFSTIGSTLEDLKLDLRIRPNQPDTFPCSKDMKKLKKLSLRWFDGSLNFLQDLPVLESLELQDSNLSSGFRDECEPHLKLQSFKTINCSSSAGRVAFDNVYKNIVKFFPNLRVLRMDYLTDPALRIIFDGLPKLEEFIAFQGIYTDQGLLGISPDTFQNKLDESCATDSDNSKQCRKPNLTQLQKLRILALDSPRLTDATVNYAIMLCKEIKSLVLASPNITDNAVRAIVDNMDLYYLQFRREYQVSRKMVRYARDKMQANGRLLFFSCNM